MTETRTYRASFALVLNGKWHLADNGHAAACAGRRFRGTTAGASVDYVWDAEATVSERHAARIEAERQARTAFYANLKADGLPFPASMLCEKCAAGFATYCRPAAATRPAVPSRREGLEKALERADAELAFCAEVIPTLEDAARRHELEAYAARHAARRAELLAELAAL